MVKKIVILGAGFGGLTAAKALGKGIKKYDLQDDYEVILVDKNAYHTYTPTLYEVASLDKETADYTKIKRIVTFPIEKLVKNLPIKFINDEVTELDVARRTGDIHLKNGYPIKYDYLILALGSQTNFFGVPGAKEAAHEFKTFADAVKIRDAVLSEAPRENICVIGGGSTGVELAGELKNWLGVKSNITIIEAGPTVLSNFEPRVIEKISKRLLRLGIKVIVNSPVVSVDGKNKNLLLQDGDTVPYDVLIWTGGVEPSSVLRALPFRKTKERTDVESGMVCIPESADLTVHGRIFGIGDITCATNPKTGQIAPQTAPAAIEQARVAAENVLRDIQTASHKKYVAKSYPYIIPVGGKWAVAKIGPLIISGFLGWVLKGLVELKYLASIMPLYKALIIWLRGLFIFIKNDRLG
ncbi:MAG: NAD(P)/FAD-dependent oxidoreductase [Candidatus Colwellbacteria bacterium]|nr:NAD(P)/FAD-dependent oxidoreductase [Candidatus Colwellbacteria bacterium]